MAAAVDARRRSRNESASCIGCGPATRYALPKKIRREILDELTVGTKLREREVKALYARFRRLAPNGYMLPEKFRHTMGAIGCTDDPFLPDRMFQVFDSDGDGQLSFTEFATSLAVMIRGEEADKLKLSFKMAAGGHPGIQLEDFMKLIRACSNTMSSLVAPPSSLSSDEDIERLFHDLSSDEGDAEGIPRMITMQAYQDAATTNADFLACLGLESSRKGSSGSTQTPERLCPPQTPDRKTARNFTTLSTCNSAGRERDLSGELRTSSRDQPNFVVTQAQLSDLRERLHSLREAISLSELGLRTQGDKKDQFSLDGSPPPGPPFVSGEPPAPEVRYAPPPEDELPSERWWPFQKCTLPLTEDGPVTKDDAPPFGPCCRQEDSIASNTSNRPSNTVMAQSAPAMLLDHIPSGGSSSSCGVVSVEQVTAELGKVLAWASDIDGVDDPSMIAQQTLDEARGCSYEMAKGADGQANTNGARRQVKPFTKSYSNVTVGNSNVPKDGKRTPQNPAGTTRWQRKRHRLLGPKKGLAVHFGHENWNMVLSMMIGIRMSVARSKHESAREIQPVDFQMKEKFSIIPRLANVFDSPAGKRVAMTRFIDYAPVVFQRIRTSFGINHDEYVKSIGPEQLLGNLVLGNLASLSELSSEGKSGAFFYYTADGNYMIKTVAPKEQLLLKGMLRAYYDHIMKNPDTLVVRFLGLHCLRVWKQDKYFGCQRRSTRKVYFVVMANMFNTPFEIHRRYDLKGSWVGRSTSAAEGNDHTVALKDVDFKSRKETFRIGPEKKTRLLKQIEIDSAFLAKQNIIDYSLLAGIHEIGVKSEMSFDGDLEAAMIINSEMTSDPDASRTGQSTSGKSRPNFLGMTEAESDAAVPIHQRDTGGMLSSDKKSLYFVGIIDILTPYDTYKVMEYRLKAINNDWRGVSCCPPPYYAERFNKFLQNAFE